MQEQFYEREERPGDGRVLASLTALEAAQEARAEDKRAFLEVRHGRGYALADAARGQAIRDLLRWHEEERRRDEEPMAAVARGPAAGISRELQA